MAEHTDAECEELFKKKHQEHTAMKPLHGKEREDSKR